MQKQKSIVISYEVINKKINKINAHYANGDSINIDELNKSYIGKEHSYENMINLCECYSVATKTPNEYVVLDCDEETQKELQAEMLKILMKN